VGLVCEGGGSGGLRYGELAGGELGCQSDGSPGLGAYITKKGESCSASSRSTSIFFDPVDNEALKL
jgi:hypothetical protein